MSRNHKDKYENSNPRRMYTLMCPEDYQSGKKSHWSELEITGSIRNLSPNLWQMTHLTALYLNDNSLQRVPCEIGRLINLRILDLSNNKLRSLPAELGELIYLRYAGTDKNNLRNIHFSSKHVWKFFYNVKPFVLFQGVVIEPKLPSRVTIRIRKVVPVTSAWTSRKPAQQGCDDTVRERRAYGNEQAADVHVGQLTR